MIESPTVAPEHITESSAAVVQANLEATKGTILAEAEAIDSYHRRQTKIMDAITDERLKQNLKFTRTSYGDQHHSFFVWDSILGEEKGEVSNAILEARFGNGSVAHVREELVQLAAVAVAILERIDAADHSLLDPE